MKQDKVIVPIRVSREQRSLWRVAAAKSDMGVGQWILSRLGGWFSEGWCGRPTASERFGSCVSSGDRTPANVSAASAFRGWVRWRVDA